MTSLLPEIDLMEVMRSHSEGLRAAATDRYKVQVGRAHSALDKLSRKAASRHDDPVDATNAAADLLERFSDGVESNGDAVVESLAQQISSTNQVQARQLEAAEERADEAERQLHDLERSAREVSNMRAQVAEAQAETARVKRELETVTADRDRLARTADQPNPDSVRVQELEAENAGLKTNKIDLERKLETVARERDELQKQLDAIRENVENQPAEAPSSDEKSVGDEADESGDEDAKRKPSFLETAFGHRKPERKSRRARN